ncbi:methyl-accepting chemotaxis protein [Acaryochloris sp. IP29b_bin.137]|uniref:methyl-accepting chemotaxis protein n=1 Tax=Acaryochloris sp. IP29b_bin.137 TaxID=2969217 RepID=UPI0026324825|nr:methyl-accepting chemotaxis protein [Acaryochloris sp. IP29b_bin.137]
MNSDQLQPDTSDQSFTISHSPSTPSSVDRVKSIVRNNLVGTITATVVGSLLLTGISSWNIWSIYRTFGETVSRKFELQKRTGQIAHYDEVLTMSARMAASTGDLKWQERYDQFVPLLDEAIGETLDNVTEEIRAEASKTDAANTRLIELETEAFELVQAKQAPKALDLLLGSEYTNLKAQYAEGNQRVLGQIDTLIQGQLQSYQQQLTASIIFAGVAFPILLAGWILVLSAVRDYIRERQEAQEKVKQSQLDLLVLNSQLQEEIEARKHQEEDIRKDNDQLQEDIIGLLDVVSTVEEGDLTTQAMVNERATGLIADTLNRLIEELGNILKQVSETSRQVSTSSNRQKDISQVVARNTDQQSQEVMQVLGLINEVRSFATNAAQQLASTNQSLVTLNAAVAQGQVEIGSLGEEIDVLQQGSDRIVQQMKTLGEFVGLTDQFVQDQGDIAEQTQMLALNAALVAARASEQTDPKKFAMVAQEFESIANQVSQLAQQTNDGLGSLEQRSTQIHRVVADVDADVQRLGGVVDDFTQGVRHTQSVFQKVQDVTGQAVESGEIVAQTSEEIVQTSEQTAMTMEAIAQLSTQIAGQSNDAQQLADVMNQLSDDLLGKVKVFKLPEETDHPILQTAASSQSDPSALSESESALTV